MKQLFTLLLLTCLGSGIASAEIIERQVKYRDGETRMKGFLAYDDAIKGKRPGVLVVHEWWGHNEYARERARMLARLGYVALAVDMYGNGKQAEHPEDAKAFSSEISNNIELGKRRFLAAKKLLQKYRLTDETDIAAIGYCFGGAVVLQMAREGVELDAVASFHGSLGTSRPAQPDKVKARILVAHGGADPFVPGEQIVGFFDEMNKANADYRFIAYSGASHAFTNPAADDLGSKFGLPLRYNAAADQASWQELQSFLASAFAD
jgi:dienelactone hydrolase